MASLTLLSSVKPGAEVLGVDLPSAASPILQMHLISIPAAEKLGRDGYRWEKPEDVSTDVSRVVLCEREESSP